MQGRKVLNGIGVLLTLGSLMLFVGGCHKKPPVNPQAQAPTPSERATPTPTITLDVSPGAIEKGQSATLRWDTTNAETVTIEPGIGTVGTKGSRVVSPSESTTYRAEARNRDKRDEATARLTVTAPVEQPPETGRPPVGWTELFSRGDVKDAFFDYDKYDIRPDAREALRHNADLFRKYPDGKFTIEGHCDERGSEEYNMALGDRRANAAKEFLADQGITADHVTTISYGKSRPFDPGHNEAAWAKNRRAHFVPR